METVDKISNRVETCGHCKYAHVSYLENIPGSAPVLVVENLPGCHVVRLTNQCVYIYCAACWIENRKILSVRPA